MIKILLTEERKKTLSDKHLEWFEKYITQKATKTKNIILKKLGLNYDDLKSIITADKEDCLYYIKKCGEISNKSENEKVYNFFGYGTWYNKKTKGWNAYKFIQELGVKICPYCNRNNIDYSEVGTQVSKSPFDHFYPKSVYPYLSCSLFNLVPCCHTCNSEKHETNPAGKKKIIYPYAEEFGENGKFKLAYNHQQELDEVMKDIREKIIKNFKLKLNSKGNLKKRISASNKIFCLNELYSQERDRVRDLLRKIDIYPEVLDRVNLLGPKNTLAFKGPMEKIFFALFFNLPEDGNKIYSYQKITMDIIEQCKPKLKKFFPRRINIPGDN